MNRLCIKQPLNKDHLCIRAKTLFPKGVRYRGVPLYLIVVSHAHYCYWHWCYRVRDLIIVCRIDFYDYSEPLSIFCCIFHSVAFLWQEEDRCVLV